MIERRASSTQHPARSGKQVDSSRHPVSFSLVLSASCFVLLCVAGCVTRSLTIKSEPPGALVYMDDQLKGRSPLSYDFLWYGWHRVTLRKAGYERLADHKLLHSPVYLWIPFDLVMELAPFRIRDIRTWVYALTPSPAMPTPVPPEIGSETNTTPPPSSQPEAAPQVNEQAGPDTAAGTMSPPAALPTQPASSSTTTTPPPAEPATAEPTTEPTHGTR